MTDRKTLKPDDLEALFAAARGRAPEARPAFLATLAEGAAAASAAQRPNLQVTPAVPPVRDAGWTALVWRALGGWPGTAGLAAASLAGVAIGLAGLGPFEAIVRPAEAAVEMLPAFDLAQLAGEG